MSDCCNTNPTSGCTENQQAVQIKIMDAKIIPLFVNLEASITALGEAFMDCCEESGTKIDEINNLLTTIIENNATCCDEILAKLACIDNILTVIEEGGVPCSSTTTTVEIPTTTTTTTGPTTTTTTGEEAPTTTTTTEEPGPTTTTTTAEELLDYKYNVTTYLCIDCGVYLGTISIVSNTPLTVGKYYYDMGEAQVIYIDEFVSMDTGGLDYGNEFDTCVDACASITTTTTTTTIE